MCWAARLSSNGIRRAGCPGGPGTVTHPDVTRSFMMIPEARELVVQAAALGDDGDALVLEMGEPVRIVDVAEQVIAMSGNGT